MIKLRDFTFDIKSDLKIELKYRDRLIRKESIECIRKVESDKNFYALDINGCPYHYCGYIIDRKNKIVKDFSEVEKLMRY